MCTRKSWIALLVLLSLLVACASSAADPAPASVVTTVPTPLPPSPTSRPLPTSLPASTPLPSEPAPTAVTPGLPYLQAAIEQALANFPGLSSYVVSDLARGERIGRNEDLALAGMSLVKVPILINTYRTLDLPLTSEQTKLITETTAQSSNFAANLLLQLIAGTRDAYAGADIVTQSLRELGIYNTFIAVPIDADPKADRLNTYLTPANQRTDLTTYADPFRQITTGDLARLLEMIYECAEQDAGPLREIYAQQISAAECQDLLAKMQLNELAKLLETGLPAGVPFAHKVGWIDDTHGDGGIVFSPSGDYLLVMALYGKEWLEWEDSAPLFEEVSRLAYAHFNDPAAYDGFTLPPTPSPAPVTATPDLPHAIVTNTRGVGLTVRNTPGGAEVAIVPDGTVLTLLPQEPRSAGGFTWQQVRTPAGDEGWAATDFFTIWQEPAP